MSEAFFVPYDAVQALRARKVAVLAPHADDEVFGCGGTLAALRAQDVPVEVLVLSDGSAGGEDSGLVEERREESRRAAALLGYPAPTFWSLPDGGLGGIEDLPARVLGWLRACDADLVLAPSCWEMHRDHRAVGEAAIAAVLELGGETPGGAGTDDTVRLAMYEVGVPLPMPSVLVDIGPWQDLKAAAMNCFASQLKRQAYARQIAALNAYRTYTLPADSVAAEAFAEFDAPALRALRAEPLARELSIGLQRADVALEQATRQKAELAQALERANSENWALRQAHDELAAEREVRLQIERSLSWRVTRPLRTLARRARAVRDAARQPGVLLRWAYRALPLPAGTKAALKVRVQAWRTGLSALTVSANNRAAATALLEHRQQWLGRAPDLPQPLGLRPQAAVAVDLSIVTYNSAAWLADLMGSLLAQTYPLERLSLFFVDNGSTDATLSVLRELERLHAARFAGFRIVEQDNRGFGAGHNLGIQQGQAPFVLVTNPDLQFEPDAIARVVALAASDAPGVACWELRQKPYEHPKHYDPVTWETNWCSHACVLLRRSAVESVGGYDERIFLYGEDVELSYRLRAAGHTLRYCPPAVVWHHAYATPGEVKPRQYVGSLTANLYLRLRYGNHTDVALALPLLLAMLLRPAFPGARRAVWREVGSRLLPHVVALLRERRGNRVHGVFPFRGFDYEFVRKGAFVEAVRLAPDEPLPLVSVVTRTVAGREDLLLQAAFSVFHQTHARIEWVVVEDGGDAQAALVERLAGLAPCAVRYESLPKLGRSQAGNRGLEVAQGEFALFLDDDDLLYADHVETLVSALRQHPGAAAAYALAWAVPSTRGADGTMVEGPYEQVASLEQTFDFALLRTRNYIPIQAILFARRLFEERGGFDTRLEYLEDWNLWQRYAADECFVHVPKTTSLYRVPADLAVQGDRQRLLDEAYVDARARADAAIEALRAQGQASAAPS